MTDIVSYLRHTTGDLCLYGTIDADLFSGDPKTADVVFSTPIPTNLVYNVVITGKDERFFIATNHTPHGFTINTNSDKELTEAVQWMAICMATDILWFDHHSSRLNFIQEDYSVPEHTNSNKKLGVRKLIL